MLGAAGHGKGSSPPHAVQKQKQELLKHPLWENIPVSTQRKALHEDQLTCMASRQQDKSRATQSDVAEDRVGWGARSRTAPGSPNPWSDGAVPEGSSSLSERAGLLPVWWDSLHARQVVSKAKGFASSLGLMVDAQHLAPAVGMLDRARESQQLWWLPQQARAAEPAQLALVRTTPRPSGGWAETTLNHAGTQGCAHAPGSRHKRMCGHPWWEQPQGKDAVHRAVWWPTAIQAQLAFSHREAQISEPTAPAMQRITAEKYIKRCPTFKLKPEPIPPSPRDSSKQDEKAASLAVGAGNPAGSIKPSLTARQPKALAQTLCLLGCQAPVRSTHALRVTQHQR